MTLMEAGPSLEVGWSLVGGDGERIAGIDEIGPGYVMIRLGLLGRQQIYVPTGALTSVDPLAGSVSIEPTAETIGHMGWQDKPDPPAPPARNPRLDEHRIRAELGLTSAKGQQPDEATSRVQD